MRQNELDSHIFEQTDYSQYKPAKKRNHDAEMDQKEQLAKHQYMASSKLNRTMVVGKTQKNGYDQKSQKQNFLKSTLDNHGY
jgi:hypothetical protein